MQRTGNLSFVLPCVCVGAVLAQAPAAPRETPLPPAEAAATFHVADDLVWEQVLAEPLVAQPVNINFDERGRMWVVQYRQYPYVEGLKVLSKDNFWRVQYDGVPKAPPHHVRGRDKVTIHEDTDGDGTFDKHKTFLDGLNLATAVEIGRGGVWVLNPPYLLFYPDKNGDDVPDGDPEVRLSGFGLSDSHSVVNSLTWGPDGWLYAAQGSTVHGDVVRPGTDDKPIHSLGQLVWRYHPEKRIYEIFAEGGGNAFGIEIDSKGRIYSGHNGGDTRGFHYVQGGYYQKGFGKHGALSNPYTFGYFAAMQHHAVPRFTHTFVIYEDAALPQSYRGKLWGVEPLQNQLVLSEITANGSSFKTKDLMRPLTCNDPWFRPVDIKVGPDGAIYVADFYERWPSHREHYDGKVFRDDGRIYRLRAKDRPLAKPVDLNAKKSTELVSLLSHENKRVRRTALRLLGDRKDAEVVPLLKEKLTAERGDIALEYLWALNLCGGLDEAAALAALTHDNPFVRIWTVRLLGDAQEVSPEIAAQLAELARTEPNLEARVQLACSARRLPASTGLPIIQSLLARDEDKDDVFQPLLLWWAIEKNCHEHRDDVLAMFSSNEIWHRPIVANHIVQRLSRRFAATGTRQDLLTCAKLLELAPTNDHKKKLLAGLEEAFAGRSLAGIPSELVKQINALGGGSLALRVRGGDAAAIEEALKTMADAKADKKLRRDLVAVFGEVRHEKAIEPLLAIAEMPCDEALRKAALGSLQPYDSPEIAERVLRIDVTSLSLELREAALALAASRPTWASQLLTAVSDGKIASTHVPVSVIRKILLHDDKSYAQVVRRLWGDIEGSTTDEMRAQVQRLSEVVRTGSGDPYAGKKLYLESCARCHKLFEDGGDIGPDLTSYQRDNFEAMLLNVVNPSAEIREGFETYNVLTDDGRVLSGFVADQDPQVLTIREADGQSHTIPRESIESQKPAPRSIMPEKLLDPLSEQQIRDLFAYLRSRQPLND